MKVLLALILTFSAYAKDFTVYPKANLHQAALNYIQVTYDQNAKFMLTSTERALAMLSPEASFAIKLKTNKLKPLQGDSTLKNLTVKIEKNNSLEFYNEYEGLQWAVKNDGTPLRVKLSDIDTVDIPATTGEDIRNLTIKEKSKEILVAVIDSGVDLEHPDLKSKIIRNEKECAAKVIYEACIEAATEAKECNEKLVDTDGNGYHLDCQGWNVAAPVNEFTQVQGNHKTQDQIGHGTFVSGIIAAQNNDIGIKGVMNNVKILPVKVSGSDEEVEEENATDIFAKGILYAINQKVDVINLSVGWASNEDSLLVTEMIKKANDAGILVVVAGGNSAHSSITYPCSYHEVICVGSHNPDGKLSHFSNKGSSIDLLAPGRRILSTWPTELRPVDFVRRHGYEYKDGTSFSAPYVVGAIAKLLNQGFSSVETRVKLLKGTRAKSATLVLNGNLDIQKAYEANTSSFVYPYKKTPALINWAKEEKKVVVRLKNYLKVANKVRIELVPRDKRMTMLKSKAQIREWPVGEIKDFEFFFKAPAFMDSEIAFDIRISSADERKVYPIQGIGVSVIHEDIKRKDIDSFRLKSRVDLSKMSFKVFDNITPYKGDDFLVVDTSQSKVRLALMKLIDDSYRISKFISTPLTDAYISHMGRLDVDQDGSIDYVVMGFMRDEDDEWITKFFVFNENFKPKKYELIEGNEIQNKLTTMTDRIFWIKREGRIVPAWVSAGYFPEADLPPLDPWEPAFVNAYQKRLYYLGEKSVRSVRLMFDEEEYLPHTIFAQNKNERNEFKVKVLFHKKESFKKTYYVADFDDIKLDTVFDMGKYHDIESIEAMDSNDNSDLIFSEFVPSDKTTRLSIFSKDENQVTQKELFYDSIFDTIQMIFSQNENDSYFALTKYNLLYSEKGRNFVSESRNTDRFVQYKKVKGEASIYLPGEFTPGLTSELITFDRGKLIRSTLHRFLPFNSCSEIGFHTSYWTDQNQVVFFCNENKTVHFINL